MTQERIIKESALIHGVSVADILGKRKTAEIVIARHCAEYIMRVRLRMKLKAIAAIFGCDHTDVIRNCRSYAKKVKRNIFVSDKYLDVCQLLFMSADIERVYKVEPPVQKKTPTRPPAIYSNRGNYQLQNDYGI